MVFPSRITQHAVMEVCSITSIGWKVQLNNLPFFDYLLVISQTVNPHTVNPHTALHSNFELPTLLRGSTWKKTELSTVV